MNSEDNWSVSTDPYSTAKRESERLVWDYCNERGIDVTVLCPGVVIGPVMAKAHTKASPIFLRDIIYGNKILNMPANFVDVRDVAKAHVNALTVSGRYLLTNEACNTLELATIASRLFPRYKFDAYPKYPPWLLKALFFVPSLKLFTQHVQYDNSKAKRDLGIDFTPLDISVRDGILSMMDQGFVTPRLRL